MKNLNYYFNQTKTENSPREADFAMLLSKINTRSEGRKDFYINTNTYTETIKSPFFAWAFGFTGFALAAFMFFFNTNNDANLAINVESNNPVVVKNKKAPVSNAINIIDSMNSFSSDVTAKEI